MNNELPTNNDFDMKMSLSCNSITIITNDNIERPRHANNNKSLSPTSSRTSSPRTSPRPQSRQDHSIYYDDLATTVSLKEQQSFQHEGSPSSQDSSTSRLSSTSNPEQSPQSDLKGDSVSAGDRKDGRRKKKSSWFNSLYPTYKSRSDEFRKLFSDVPVDERLVVDYSCALQKEILVQGRLYVTQNYLCFYANIFGWETNLTLKWRDVAAMTKEKTALVIPNAVYIYTKTEKFFFTSLVQRDKTYMMLFRIWQNALMDQPTSAAKMWQWVRQCYGEELGLTSEDEDYISSNSPEEGKLSSRLLVDSLSEIEKSSTAFNMDQLLAENKMEDLPFAAQPLSPTIAPLKMPTEMSDSESDNKPISMKKEDTINLECTSSHDGRVLLNETYPIHIDQLFTLLFTSSKFYLNFHASRKSSDLTQTPWTHNPIDNSKSRVVNLTMALTQTIGPKSCQVTERHSMLPCSKSGGLYAVDIETVNAGIPYADSFYVTAHYCIKKISDTHSSIHVTAQLKFKKTVWGFVKGMIERNAWSGLEDFFANLKEALQAEGEENIPEQRRKSRRRKRLHTLPKYSLEDVRLNIPRKKSHSSGMFTTDVCTALVFGVLLVLLVINVMLYYKLWSLEEDPSSSFFDFNTLKNSPKSHDDWIKLLQQQENFHSVEAQKWQRILKSAVDHLHKAEEFLNELQQSIHLNYMSEVISAMQKSEKTKSDL